MDKGLLVFLLIVCGGIPAYIIFLLIKVSKLKNQNEDLQSDKTKMQNRIDQLSVYEKIEDAEAESKDILKAANKFAEQIRNEATNKLIKATEDAEQIKQEASDLADSIREAAREESKEIRGKADQMIERSRDESKRVLEWAHQKAKSIAGEALEAKGKADLFEKTVTAMKNIIDGYGDTYLIPNHAAIDDLAEDFSHKDAGIRLKHCRVVTRSMVTRMVAADCDYVEENRRETAVRFVLDAFNGKVDTALSKVRDNNYGKLRQEILDAFNLVNYNGQAFRNAGIRDEYLNARLEELKWAVAVQELKTQEKEEQRRIKEAMREEEKARREYEKALKESDKEEKTIQKALLKAKQEMEAASSEQREQYESRLAELQEQLRIAEEKSQRAKSMAQQTRQGHVYVISNIGSFGENVFKIGLTRRLEPLDRIKELGGASVPFAFDVHAMIFSEDAPKLERDLHKNFEPQQLNKVNSRKEFFKVSLSEIKEHIDDLGINPHWTMMAEALEYRESLATESSFPGHATEASAPVEHAVH